MNIEFPADLTWTLGFSYDDYEEKNLQDQSQVRPAMATYAISAPQTLRHSGRSTPLVANRTIQPTQVAGFNQFFDDVNGTEAWRYAAGLDARLTEDLSAGAEVSKRNLSEPVLVGIPGRMIREHRDESLYRAYLYWTRYVEWAVTAEFQYDDYDSSTGVATEQADLPTKVEIWSAPLSIRYFSPLGLFGVPTGTVLYQDVRRRESVSRFLPIVMQPRSLSMPL